MSKEDILVFLRSNKSYIQENFNVTEIGLFGSYATGDNTPESDIDILVTMPPSFDGFYQLKEYLEDNLQKTVDLGLFENLRILIKKQIADEIIYV